MSTVKTTAKATLQVVSSRTTRPRRWTPPQSLVYGFVPLGFVMLCAKSSQRPRRESHRETNSLSRHHPPRRGALRLVTNFTWFHPRQPIPGKSRPQLKGTDSNMALLKGPIFWQGHREKQIQDQIEDHCRIDEVELDRASQALTRAKNLLSKSGKYGAPMVTSLQTPLINQSPLSLLPCQRILRILHLADNPNPARSFRSSSRRTANLRPAQVRNLKVA